MIRVLFAAALVFAGPASAIDLPDGFQREILIEGLRSPSGFEFSPDGRMFVCERIVGELRVASLNAATQEWELNAEPFYTFDIPKSAGIPDALRSSGLRDVAFDPNFATNGYVYAFYMHDGERHNRVVRIQASVADPDVADPTSETFLLEMPSNGGTASGSHNGGALEIGNDGYLYISTGDGWNGGDTVQSLGTYTGKVFRIDLDGSIPTDNPFYNDAAGDLRAIYALGLRNPFTMTKDLSTGAIYVNDVAGSNKGNVYVVAAGANYGHDGYNGIGVETDEWADAGAPAGRVVSGGTWIPTESDWPVEYRAMYMTSTWNTSGSSKGYLNLVDPADLSVNSFASDVGVQDPVTFSHLNPVTPRIGPDFDLYYVLTTYEDDNGAVHVVRGPEPVSVTEEGVAVVAKSFPTPFNATSTIVFTMPESGNARVSVFDVSGRRMLTVTDGPRSAGTHRVEVDGAAWSPGVYYFQVDVDGAVVRNRLVRR